MSLHHSRVLFCVLWHRYQRFGIDKQTNSNSWTTVRKTMLYPTKCQQFMVNYGKSGFVIDMAERKIVYNKNEISPNWFFSGLVLWHTLSCVRPLEHVFWANNFEVVGCHDGSAVAPKQRWSYRVCISPLSLWPWWPCDMQHNLAIRSHARHPKPVAFQSYKYFCVSHKHQVP
jgi:hypothetical protein